MPTSDTGLFSAVLGLSRQANSITLTQVLADSLVSHDLCGHVSVFEMHAEGDAPDAAGNRQSFRRFGLDEHRCSHRDMGPGVIEAGHSQAPVSVRTDTGERLVVPVTSPLGPVRLLALDGVTDDPTGRMRALQLIEVYGNLVNLMDGRERDELTGLLNRKLFATLYELSKAQIEQRHDESLHLAVLDIDRFKRINDTFGHLFGDEVLIHFARQMKLHFRYCDHLFRFGGEEFLVLMAAPPDGARTAFERFRAFVEAQAFPGVGEVTVSIGYTACDETVLPTTLIDRADKALYRAKETGRNQVLSYEETVVEPARAFGDVDLF